MDNEQTRADSPVDTVPGVELTEEQKAAHQKAKEAGWTEKVAIDYAQHERNAATDGEWFGAAKVYEWNPEEYGEVGPAIPELEQVLFEGEFQQRRGEHMEALELEVAIEGPNNDRIRKVSEQALIPLCISPALTRHLNSSRMQGSTRS